VDVQDNATAQSLRRHHIQQRTVERKAAARVDVDQRRPRPPNHRAKTPKLPQVSADPDPETLTFVGCPRDGKQLGLVSPVEVHPEHLLDDAGHPAHLVGRWADDNDR
jgi:hypothetical protein